MNAKTLTVLKSSIEHWKRMATGKQKKDEVPFARCCDLCNVFIVNDCRGCPVFNKTGLEGCDDTPYIDASDRFIEDKGKFKNPAFIAAAQKELEFLESLLPKEKTLLICLICHRELKGKISKYNKNIHEKCQPKPAKEN